MNNNDSSFVKGKIDMKLGEVFKSVLAKLNMTQQDFIDKTVKEFIIENIHLVVDEKMKSDKK